MENNNEKTDKNWLSIMLITVSALFFLFAVFYGIRRMWNNSSAQENPNIEQQSDVNQNINSNNTSNENSTPNNSSTPNTLNSNQNTTNETTANQTNQAVNSYDNITALEIDTLHYSLTIKQEDTKKVQVEYNNIPPGFNIRMACGTMDLCKSL